MVSHYRDLSRYDEISPDELEQMLRTFDRFEDRYDPLGQATYAQLRFERLVANMDRLQQQLSELRVCLPREDASL